MSPGTAGSQLSVRDHASSISFNHLHVLTALLCRRSSSGEMIPSRITLTVSLPVKAQSLLIEIIQHPVVEPAQKQRSIVAVRQAIGEVGSSSRGTAGEHLADELEIPCMLLLSNGWLCGLTKLGHVLYCLPEGRDWPPPAVPVVAWLGVPQPLEGRIGPHSRQLVKERIGVLDAHLMQAFPLVDKLHTSDTALSIPAVTRPDGLHPVFMGDGDLFGLVVDATGMYASTTELIAGASPPMLMHLTLRQHGGIVGRVVPTAVGWVAKVGLAIVAASDEGISLLQFQLPTGNVSAQMGLADLEREGLSRRG